MTITPTASIDAEQSGLRWEEVRAWTETRTTRSLVARPTSLEECGRVIEFARERGLTICPRGAGYSYADMILNEGQIVLDTAHMHRIRSWNGETGELVAEPGVTFAQILRETLVSGWTIPSCVGGMGVTVAGAVSNNVHGKDSWKLGNFGEAVRALKLLTSRGEVLSLSRRANEDLLRAVVAGMGLLGVIVEVTLQLRNIPSAFVERTMTPVRSLTESLDIMERECERCDFAIAWVDTFATGPGAGRGTVETARWIESDRRVDREAIEASLCMPTRVFGWLPASLTWKMARPVYGPTLVRAVNAVRYRWSRRTGRTQEPMLFTDFNFMLNKIPGWKDLYRPHGYYEFQPMVPRKRGAEALSRMLRLCQEAGTQSLLCAIKPHRPDDYLLSYAGDGYSFGIDIKRRGRTRESVERFARMLYDYVADVDGRTFLAKDEVLPRDLFERMYPLHKEFMRAKRMVDPDQRFMSDMGRRLLA